MDEKEIKVLLIEDNPGDVRLIEDMLSDGANYRFELECAGKLSDGLVLLDRNDYDLVLLDLGLPDSQGLETFFSVYARAAHLPIVALTGIGDETLAVKAVQHGAQDYLVKGHVDSSSLQRALRYAIERKSAEQTLKEYRKKMARAELLASLGTLSATLAHELNQSLTVIGLSIENSLDELLEVSSPEPAMDYLRNSLSEVENAVAIVERFCSFSRKSSGTVFDQVSLQSVGERVVGLLNKSARHQKVIINLEELDKLPSIYVNQNDVEQLFFSLIQNATQASDGKKRSEINISGKVKDDNVELMFADTCGGIEKEKLEKIFEPFFTTKPSGQGTGLGLCIVQQLIAKYGGNIRAESKYGSGTTFYVTLPIHFNAERKGVGSESLKTEYIYS